jgi:hypothetical protein
VVHAGGAAGALGVPLVDADEGADEGAVVGCWAGDVAAADADADAGEVDAGADRELAASDGVAAASSVRACDVHPARRPTAIMAGSASPVFQVRMGVTFSCPQRRAARRETSIPRVHRRMLSVVTLSISPSPDPLREARRTACPAEPKIISSG